jgi:3-hydroxyacyl-CoA dehydrogenase/enoyl-CoA hydratase/3-hydroxybutyryl-CoA epimerase
MTNTEEKITRLEMENGVAHIILDAPGSAVNVVGREFVEELNGRLDEAKNDPAVKAVVIRSAKGRIFIAGADLNEIRAMALSADAQVKGREASAAGQALTNKIEDLKKPVVAAIHGACLGGGLELSLACAARVASDDPETIMGLPEVKLGLVPGWGGTYRLQRVIGFMRALTAILSSTNFNARQALKMGLVDDMCYREQLAQVAQSLALKLADKTGGAPIKAARNKKKPLIEKLSGLPVIRDIIGMLVMSAAVKKTHAAYPAVGTAVRLVTASAGKKRTDAMKKEADALGLMLSTRACLNLVRIFFLSQEAKKQAGAEKPPEINSVGIVGSGLMGSGIAINLTHKAFIKTMLKDTDIPTLGRALKKIGDFGSKRVKQGKLNHVEANKRFYLVSAAAGYGGFNRADLVIEAVPEIMELKQKLFRELEPVVKNDAIIASNTSSLPISGMAAGLANPERFIGMHFFMPAEVMPLVEIIAGERTNGPTIAGTVGVALAMGKTPVVVKDSPGFLVNRVLSAYMLEAALMVDEGVSPGIVDSVAVDFGMPMGPMRLTGEVGVEVLKKVLHTIQAAYGDRMKAPEWILRDDLANAFSRGKDGKWKADAAVISGWVSKKDPGLPADDIRDRLYISLLNESARCLSEGIVTSPGMLDLAMVFGIGFPAFRGGPLAEADSMGMAEVISRAGRLASKYGPRFNAPEIILKMEKDGTSFFPGEGKHG